MVFQLCMSGAEEALVQPLESPYYLYFPYFIYNTVLMAVVSIKIGHLTIEVLGKTDPKKYYIFV